MKAFQYLRQLWSGKARRQPLLCSNIETESIETQVAQGSQQAELVEGNLIDLNDDVSFITSINPTPHASTSLGTLTDASPVDPLPTDLWKADTSRAPPRWTQGELLGAGAYGKVFLGLNRDTGELMAVKQVQVPREIPCRERVSEHVAALESEVEVLKQLQHPNIVRYLGTERREESLNIFLEYAAGGSVASLLSRFGPLDETLIKVFTRQILRGLEFLHQRRTAHRDIKGGNILVDHQGIVKLADFGASKRIEHLVTVNSGFKSLKGTPYWMAPEVIKQTGHGRQADIWSVGCTVIEMATGQPPWSDVANNVTVLFHIVSSKGSPPIPEHFSHEAKDFLRLCFNRNPKERPNASRLLLHPFVASAGSQAPVHRHQQRWPCTYDAFPASHVDAAAEILEDTATEDATDSVALNLVSEPSTGMTLKPVPTSSRPGCTPQRGRSDEACGQSTVLKEQWADELAKELAAMKSRPNKADS